tara:strand:+ start:21923 stop:22933 length:1011 start_codon:yes stop_codon:yes gene_type:complete
MKFMKIESLKIEKCIIYLLAKMLTYLKPILLFIIYVHSVSISAQESNDRLYINVFDEIFDIEINQFPDKEYLKAIYEINYNDRGIIDTVENNMLHLFDEFDEYHMILPSQDSFLEMQENKTDFKFLLVAGSYSDSLFEGIFTLTFEFPMDTVLKSSGSTTFLVDKDRFKYNFNIRKLTPDTVLMNVSTTDQSVWASLGSSNNARFRISGNVIRIDNILKKQIRNTVKIIESNLPKINEDKEETVQTYLISWDTNLPRKPIIQVMPSNVLNIEGSITVQFEVNPNGTIGIIKRLHDMKPEFEIEIFKALRGWRFEKLPLDKKQISQSGSITFYFVRE